MMKEKRAKIKFLMLVLGKTYWQASLQERLERLKMCLREDHRYDYKHEHLEGLA